jgi:hypothetical protein
MTPDKSVGFHYWKITEHISSSYFACSLVVGPVLGDELTEGRVLIFHQP